MAGRTNTPRFAVPNGASKPVSFGGELFHVAGRRVGAGFSFWIERPQGKIWRHISGPEADLEPRSLTRGREIVALTSEEPAVKEVALASGWFQSTGRTLRFPFTDDNEVWALTTECLRLFSAPAPVHRTEPGEDLPSYSPSLSTFLGGWVRRNAAQLEVAGVLVLGPAPLAHSPDERVLLGAFPENLTRLNRSFSRPAAAGPLVQSFALSGSQPGWEGAAAAQGYRAGVQVSVPAVAGRTFDAILLWTRSTPLAVAGAAVAALNAWPDMQRMMLSDSPLTPRDLECLRYTASGYTAEECAQLMGFTEANVRHHLKKVMRRLGAPNTVSAIQRAQLMGVLG